MENNNGGSGLGWILGFIVIVVFAAWLLGGAVGSGSDGPAAGWVLMQ